ncbi:MAG: hypothetical protein ACOYKZ_04245 [Chlamydiia bacterium]
MIVIQESSPQPRSEDTASDDEEVSLLLGDPGESLLVEKRLEGLLAGLFGDCLAGDLAEEGIGLLIRTDANCSLWARGRTTVLARACWYMPRREGSSVEYGSFNRLSHRD